MIGIRAQSFNPLATQIKGTARRAPTTTTFFVSYYPVCFEPENSLACVFLPLPQLLQQPGHVIGQVVHRLDPFRVLGHFPRL